jgi:hypothetical protein
MKVFISHSSSDKWVARQISRQLDEFGVDSFLDEKDIETGDSIDQTIQEHLSDCDELLMLLSPAALDSPWVLIEVGGAKALKKRLVPILLHVGTNDLPAPLATGLARDLNDIESYYEEIRRRNEEIEVKPPTHRPPVVPAAPRAVLKPRIFSVGDRVRLPRTVPQSTYGRDGTDVGWNPEMERYMGEIATITWIDKDRVSVDIDAELWIWLMDWLEPVHEGDAAGE